MKIFDSTAIKAEISATPLAVIIYRTKEGKIVPTMSRLSDLERTILNVKKVAVLERIYEGVEANAYLDFINNFYNHSNSQDLTLSIADRYFVQPELL